MTKERPILFKAEMVQAILEGRKTQTRRVVKREAITRAGIHGILGGTGPAFGPCPYGEPGDRLWVKEPLEIGEVRYHGWCAFYKRDGIVVTPLIPWRWKAHTLSSLFMPKAAARLWLEITGVRVERVQKISAEDVQAEGIDVVGRLPMIPPPGTDLPRLAQMVAHQEFRLLWDGINGERGYLHEWEDDDGNIHSERVFGYGWEANPWVWVVEFRVAQTEAT